MLTGDEGSALGELLAQLARRLEGRVLGVRCLSSIVWMGAVSLSGFVSVGDVVGATHGDLQRDDPARSCAWVGSLPAAPLVRLLTFALLMPVAVDEG